MTAGAALNRIINKLFCLHDWETHVKKEQSWVEEKLSIKSTKDAPVYLTITGKEITEYVKCKNCGNFKKLEY